MKSVTLRNVTDAQCGLLILIYQTLHSFIPIAHPDKERHEILTFRNDGMDFSRKLDVETN